MPIDFTCPCGRKWRVGDERAGQPARCSHCGREIRIPAKSGAVEARNYERLTRAAFGHLRQFYLPPIPEAALRKARAGYARSMEPGERPLALSRRNLLARLFRTGWLFTDRGVYYRNGRNGGAFHYADIRNCRKKIEHVTSRHGNRYEFLTVEVELTDGGRHRFPELLAPFFEMLDATSCGSAASSNGADALQERTVEKRRTGSFTIVKLIGIAALVSGLAGLLALLLIKLDVFKDENAPYEAAMLFFILTFCFGWTLSKPYACGECGKRVAGFDRFCPRCKRFFR